MRQQSFVFEDHPRAEWVYSCPLERGVHRWRAHRVLRKTDKRLYVARRSIPIEDMEAGGTPPAETGKPFQLNRRWFERDGWHRHTGKRNSCFYIRPGMERQPSPDEIAEEDRRRYEAHQREQEAWRAANPEAWAEQQRQSDERIRRIWAEAEEEARRYRAAHSGGPIIRFANPTVDARTLGVNWPCSSAELKSAYRRLAKQHHPDVGGSAEEFRRVNEAYERLTRAV